MIWDTLGQSTTSDKDGCSRRIVPKVLKTAVRLSHIRPPMHLVQLGSYDRRGEPEALIRGGNQYTLRRRKESGDFRFNSEVS